jgi:hypothetical protein
MKPTKLFWGEKRLKDVYVGATKFEVFKYRASIFMRRTLTVSGLICAFAWAVVIGSHYFPKTNTVYATETIEVPVEVVPPVMERIAKCESGNTHYRNGQVIMNANTNKTVDIGKYQINSIWNKKATELGLNLTDEKDNEAMAMYIYKTHGTEPWYSSKACWNK